MQFDKFIRRPFQIEAIEITAENMPEIAKLIGEMRVKDGMRYIALDRRIVPNVPRAYIGWFMTRLGDNFRCYTPKMFKSQFMPYSEELTFSFEDEDENIDGVPSGFEGPRVIDGAKSWNAV